MELSMNITNIKLSPTLKDMGVKHEHLPYLEELGASNSHDAAKLWPKHKRDIRRKCEEGISSTERAPEELKAPSAYPATLTVTLKDAAHAERVLRAAFGA
jgi:hypothetical protein